MPLASIAMARKASKRSPKAPKKAARKRASASAAKFPPNLLSGGNPQIAKADGDAPVKAYIAAMPGWKRNVGKKLDAVITKAAGRGLQKAVKWNSPFYGMESPGGKPSWFLSFHCFNKYVKVAFFRGASLTPLPPGKSEQKDVRYLDIHEDEWGGTIEERQVADWVKQASKLPGWGGY